MSCVEEKTEETSKTEVKENPYKDWLSYTKENIVINYPPGHPLEGEFDKTADRYIISIAQIARILEIPPIEDTVVIMYYTGFGQGQKMTGEEYPFVRNDTIHFWLPSFLGPTLMHYMIPRWVPKEPRYPFFKHGLISLLDMSGQNYHYVTMHYIKKEKFIPLEELAVDTNINSNTERYQSGEAASFVAFVIALYGIDKLELMYRSELPFEEMIWRYLILPVDSAQTLWLEFAEKNVPDSLKQELENIE
jgi:hypothetical protein